jgi:hypothetical protein
MVQHLRLWFGAPFARGAHRLLDVVLEPWVRHLGHRLWYLWVPRVSIIFVIMHLEDLWSRKGLWVLLSLHFTLCTLHIS